MNVFVSQDVPLWRAMMLVWSVSELLGADCWLLDDSVIVACDRLSPSRVMSVKVEAGLIDSMTLG